MSQRPSFSLKTCWACCSRRRLADVNGACHAGVEGQERFVVEDETVVGVVIADGVLDDVQRRHQPFGIALSGLRRVEKLSFAPLTFLKFVARLV